MQHKGFLTIILIIVRNIILKNLVMCYKYDCEPAATQDCYCPTRRYSENNSKLQRSLFCHACDNTDSFFGVWTFFKKNRK